ncbi:hypothetical protein Tco_0392898 [Tanacetum coccineum]
MAIVAEVFDDDDGGGRWGGELIGFKEVMKVVEEKGVELPGEMFEAAKSQGLREVLLTRYLDLQVLI